jgi:hypothetical protein
MDSSLHRYLNDHLAGSAVAIELIEAISQAQVDPEETQFFTKLQAEVERDRELLIRLIERLGQNESGLRQAAGAISAKASRLKLWWEGLELGELGLFEALEVLTLGIQGKRALWALLAEIAPWLPEWRGVAFAEFEMAALSQRDAVEIRRIEAGKDALIESERKSPARSQ